MIVERDHVIVFGRISSPPSASIEVFSICVLITNGFFPQRGPGTRGRRLILFLLLPLFHPTDDPSDDSTIPISIDISGSDNYLIDGGDMPMRVSKNFR